MLAHLCGCSKTGITKTHCVWNNITQHIEKVHVFVDNKGERKIAGILPEKVLLSFMSRQLKKHTAFHFCQISSSEQRGLRSSVPRYVTVRGWDDTKRRRTCFIFIFFSLHTKRTWIEWVKWLEITVQSTNLSVRRSTYH